MQLSLYLTFFYTVVTFCLECPLCNGVHAAEFKAMAWLQSTSLAASLFLDGQSTLGRSHTHPDSIVGIGVKG